MTSYDAGEAYLQILPTTRGFAQRLKRELAGERTEYQVPVTLDLDRRGLAGLRSALRALPAVVLTADASDADREVSALRERIERLSGQTIGIDVSGEEARRELDSISSDLERLGARSPNIQIQVDAGAAEAAVLAVRHEVSQLDGRRVNLHILVDAAQAIASVAAVALAVNRFANKDYRFKVDADVAGALGSISMLVSRLGALGGMAGVIGGLGGALGGLGAAGAVAGAGLGATILASLGVGKALSAMSAQQDAAMQTGQQAAKQQQSQAYAIASAYDRAKQASTQADRARVEGAQAVGDAEKSASRQVEQALKAQETAQKTLRTATTELRREQSQLSSAWEDGRRSLEDLQSQLRGNTIDQRQAAIDLRDAEDELRKARSTGNADAIERATVAYDRQKATVDDLATQGERLTADNAAAQKKGVEGSDAVVAANDRIAAAQARVDDATTAAADAATELTRARVDGAESVRRAQVESAQRIADADQQVIESNRALAQAMAQTGDAGQSAADKVQSALADLSPAAAAFAMYLFGLQPILKGLSATAATEFFPPLQQGLGLLVAQAPLVNGMVAMLASSMGGALRMVLTAIASPEWMSFFQLLSSSSTTLIPLMAQVLLEAAGAGRDLLAAFLPLAPASLALVSQAVGLVRTLTPFLAMLLGGLIPAASAFLSALTPLGPVLAALQPILLVLGQSLATVVLAVLQALAPILVALTPLIQALAQALAADLVSTIQTLTPLLVFFAGQLSAHPGLVIGVIHVLGFLALAFKPLLWILGIAATLLHGFLIRAAAMAILRAAGLEATLFGRALMLLLRPIELVKWGLALLARLVGAAGGPFAILRAIIPAVGRLIMYFARTLLMAIGPVGWLVTGLFLLYQSNEQFRNAVNQLVGTLFGLVGQLVGALMPAVQAVINAVGPLVSVLASALTPVITIVAQVLVQLINLVLPVLVAVITNVVVPVVSFLANVLATVLVWVITNLVLPVFQGLAWVLSNVVAPAIGWLWSAVVQPVFLAIGAFIGWVWTNLIKPALDGLVWLWTNVVAPALVWLWTSVIQPVFGFIGAAANVLYQIVAVVLVLPLVLAFQLIAFVATWLWTSVLQPTFLAIGTFLGWVWTTLIKPAWDQMVWVIQNVITPAVLWLWHTIFEPAFRGMGAVIQWVWLNVIRPAWDALMGGLGWLRDGFRTTVDWIGQKWNGLRSLLAKPINFLIGTVFNNGIRKAWNFAADLLPGVDPINPLPLIPEYAAGGLLQGPGTGTSDSILGVNAAGLPIARVSNDEFVVRAAVTRQVLPFLTALNAGDGEALQAAGLHRVAKAYRGPKSGIPAYAAGGPIDERIAAAKQWLSSDALGIPYVWGGGSRAGMDCSGMQAAVTHILSGRSPYSGRIGTTASMPWGGFVPGLNGAYAIGNKPSDHMAGTLAGQNVEQHGPAGSPFQFPSRWGADNGYFTQQYHLQQLGGAFVSGGSGGGGLSWILDKIRGYFDSTTDPLIDGVRAVMGAAPPKYRDIPPNLATTARDKVRDFLFGQAEQMGGGDGVDVTGITGPVRDQVQQVAQRFGWGTGPEWDAIVKLVAKESGWNPNAANPTTSARGLFQKMTSLHGPVEDTPAGQAAWGLNYIRGRYGDPIAAWAFHQQHNSYDEGGIGRGIGLMWKGTGLDERVLDPQETQAYPTLTRLSQQLEAGRVPVPTGVNGEQYAAAVAGAVGGDGASGRGDTYNFNAAAWDERRMLAEIDRRNDARARVT